MSGAKKMKAIKGFDAKLKCRNFQFEVGHTYKHEGEVKACRSGFHAVPDDLHPLTVFRFYPPAGSRFCVVEVEGATDRETDKIAAEILTVQREIGLHDLTAEAVKWVMDRATLEGPVAVKDNGLATASGCQGAATASGYQGAATASGYQGAATASGYQGAATASGDQGAAMVTGYRGAATASGYRGAATASGDQGAAMATGYQGAATASGYRGAATASGDQGAATASGYQGAAMVTGYRGAATASGDQGAAMVTGYRGAATASGYRGAATASGCQGAAMATGYGGKVIGKTGNALFAIERKTWDGPIVSVACGIVGQDGIEADTWYCCKGGKLVEIDQ